MAAGSTARLVQCKMSPKGEMRKTRHIAIATSSKRSSFPTLYTPEDVSLLVLTDNAHGRLSGKATKEIMRREHDVFGKVEFNSCYNPSVMLSKSSTFTVLVLVAILVSAAALKITQTFFNSNGAGNVLDRVSKHILITRDPAPSITILDNAEELRGSNPAFYKDAQNGDTLLLWRDKAVLYSSKLDRIVAATLIAPYEPSSSTDNSLPLR